MTTAWTRNHVALIGRAPPAVAPVIRRDELRPLLPDTDLWDFWPVQTRDGRLADVSGGALVMLLSAPRGDDPDARHGCARIRLMHQLGSDWVDLGAVLPDALSPGSREWAGSAILEDDWLTLYFTAAGRRGEAQLSYEQRLFEVGARLSRTTCPRLSDWSEPVELVQADGKLYQRDLTGGGAIGTIKAFRDPAYFRDPADAAEYLVFAASLAQSASPWNGAIGLAEKTEACWRLRPPLVAADGVNNELERPHLVARHGLYYLFWSTQQRVFATNAEAGPNGLYGMVADRISGPYRPLNGSGLVFANPAQAPFQAYSWVVLDDLRVLSFADVVGLDRLPMDTLEARQVFGGTPAPVLQLALEGERAWLT